MPPKETTTTPPTPLVLSEILADLTSLRVCDPAAALALVSARPSGNKEVSKGGEGDADPDLKRAKDLVELHYSVKEAHREGRLDSGLGEARRAVERVVGG